MRGTHNSSYFIFPFRSVVCLLVNGIAFHTETNAFMNNNAEPRSFPFPFREVWRLHGAFQRPFSSKSNVIRLYMMYYLLDYFAVALVTYASKLLSCNSTGLSLHGCRWTAASGCCMSRLVHSFVFICFPSMLSSHLQQGSHTSISEVDGTDPGAQMLPGKLSFLLYKHIATISGHLDVMYLHFSISEWSISVKKI